MDTISLRRHGHIVGMRSDRVAEQSNETAAAALQGLFEIPIPGPLLQIMLDLADCVLYYGFDAVTQKGKMKRYSEFVLTNIEPGFGEVLRPYQLASTIGYLWRFRGMGLPHHYLPFACASTKWFFCDLRPESGNRVVVAKSDHEFETDDRSWVTVAHSFQGFVESLQVDLRFLKRMFRVCGPTDINPLFLKWLEESLGNDWQAKLDAEPAYSRRKPSPKKHPPPDGPTAN